MSDGKIHEWSDLDLVIIKDTDKSFYERVREVATICDSDVSVHFFVYTPQELTQLKQEGHFFVNHEVIDKGMVLYERA
jgi:predicted nucleotidyltransferase